MTARTAAIAKQSKKEFVPVTPTLRYTKAQLLDLSKELIQTNIVLNTRITGLEQRNVLLEAHITDLTNNTNLKPNKVKSRPDALKPDALKQQGKPAMQQKKSVVKAPTKAPLFSTAVSNTRRRVNNHQYSWTATLLPSNNRILQIHFDKQLYPGWTSDAPFLVLLDAPQSVDTFDEIKSYLKSVLMKTHSDKISPGATVCVDQGIIVGFIQEVKSDIVKLNRNGVWSLSGKKCLEAYTDMITTLQNENLWTDQVELKMLVGAYMDASRRNSGA